jgi:hypothetical protein
MRRRGPRPRDRCVIRICRQLYWEQDVDYRKMVARHFTGTFRHVMYRFEMAAILEQGGLARHEKQLRAE